MKPHSFHPEASDEYAKAAEYYSEIDSKLGGRFYDEIENLIQKVRADPERFRIFDPPTRRILSAVFPFGIIYVEHAERILVLAVMHLKRRPGYWKNRL